MTIELSEQTIGIWFVSLGNDQDFMAHVHEDEASDKYILNWRMRYYKDDDPFSNKDVKEWHSGSRKRSSTTKEEVIVMMHRIFTGLVETSDSECFSEILMDETGLDGLLKKMKNTPGFHMKVMTKEEYEEEYSPEERVH